MTYIKNVLDPEPSFVCAACEALRPGLKFLNALAARACHVLVRGILGSPRGSPSSGISSKSMSLSEDSGSFWFVPNGPWSPKGEVCSRPRAILTDCSPTTMTGTTTFCLFSDGVDDSPDSGSDVELGGASGDEGVIEPSD